MNTPDTEWEKEFDDRFKFTEALNSDLKTWRFSLNFTMPQIKRFITDLLTSRDTYWKERVEGEREILLKVIDDSNLGGQHDWLIKDIKSK